MDFDSFPGLKRLGIFLRNTILKKKLKIIQKKLLTTSCLSIILHITTRQLVERNYNAH